MPKSTKHARILDFPFGLSLSGGRVDRLQEVTNDRRCDYILDYQELVHTSPILFSEGKKVFERVKGYYMLLENLSAETALARVRERHPWALPDSHHWLVLRWLAQKLRSANTVEC